MLLSAKVDLILKEQIYKENILVIYSTGHIKIIIILSIKVIVFYRQTLIVQVGVLGLKKFILGFEICLAIFLAFDKQF